MANSKALVIVESPSKAKTIGKFLGSNYKVIASVGHIRDLPKSKLGINIENNFEPEYISIRGKGDVIKAMKAEAKNASKIYLATDNDREGEAISWHIAFLLGIDEKKACRIVFNEITKTAIQKAVKNARQIDLKLVDAQQARRVLDRLVGYQISPLLWRKVRRGLSAGRVQSAALKIICDREKLIKAFIPKEFWNISAVLQGLKKLNDKSFSVKLSDYKGKKISVDDKMSADKILSELKDKEYIVNKVEKKERTRKAYPPFTTSSLQQDASNKLGFQTKKTMQIAQQLYEGVDVKGRGTVGLVTYIRTDSVRISEEAISAAAVYITEKLGKEYLGKNVYTNKKKDVQDAHEAIRPSYIELSPDEIKVSLTKDQFNLYKLIWSRFMASQMTAAVYDSVSAEIKNGDYSFRATGSKIKFDGYLKLYVDNVDESDEKMLPALEEGDKLNLEDLMSEQNFTQPPARFTEASLVKDLEEKDIGRPSTYVPIIGTLLERRYIIRDKKSLVPTDLGFIVTELLEKYFKEIVDADFTAKLEDRLDDIEIKNIDWKEIVGDFYGILKEELIIADAEIEKLVIEDELTGEMCEKCGKPMAKKQGRFGEFIACTGYPECKNTKQIVNKVDAKCPKCGKDIIVRRGKSGRVFYGCNGYPECDQVFWSKPTSRKCPNCNSIIVEKKTKNSSYACSNNECGYKE
ncbi:MAG: type I DNA topoisomerase [Peptostreptococcaceae bacterium]|nr:type I DNA topoisomerase [Peptostreptococcaceae bacterium]